MNILKNGIAAVLLFGIYFIGSSPVLASSSQLKATVVTKDTTKPTLTLTNAGTEPCQVANTSLGTVSVNRMEQSGNPIKPISINVAFEDGLRDILLHSMKTLKPQESVTIPLEVYKLRSDYALQTVTWSQSAGAYGVVYPFLKNKPYILDVTYAVPLSALSGAPMCGMATASNAPSFDLQNYMKPIVISVILVLILLLLSLFWRSKNTRKKVAAASIFVFFVLSGAIAPVQANYSIPTEAAGRFDECMAMFDRYPDITGPILDDIDPETIYIFTNDVHVNDATDWPDGSYHIRWDPNSEYNYYSDDGSIIPSTPCDRLFHELYHVYEIRHRTNDRTECAGSGIDTDEVNATRIQNRLREAMGLPARTHYEDHRLPEGDCHPAPPPEPHFGCGFSCSSSWGEPHLKTIDQRSYDFQTVGEFIAAKDTNGFELQVRQQPWAASRYVSMNESVAMKVGTDKVEFRIPQQKLELLINGKVTPLSETNLSGGNISVEQNQSTITWLDGTKVVINYDNLFGLILFFVPSESRKTHLTGLLASYNGEQEDVLHHTFADTWRVTDASSLFTYEKGKNTAAYTDKTFPDKYINPNDLVNKEFAEKICRDMGVTDKTLLKNCILDVGLTGRPEFAKSAAMVQEISDSSAATVENVYKLTVNKAGEGASAAFTGKAKEKVFIKVLSTTFTGQCGGFGIKNAEDVTIATGCMGKGGGFVDTTELPIDGTYTLFINPADQKPGQLTVQLFKVQDSSTPIEIDGKPVNATIATPGGVAEFSFNGTKGQKVLIEFPSTTLSGQCGGLSLIPPDKTPLGSGCIGDGKGALNPEGIELPETGSYTIRIDPGEDRTGSITVTVKPYAK